MSKVETVPPSLNCDQGSCLKEDTKIVFNVTNGCEIIKEVGIETKGCENEVKNSVKTMNQIESNPISGILIPGSLNQDLNGKHVHDTYIYIKYKNYV